MSLSTGEVTAAAAVTAEVGRPLVLSCHITTESDHIVRQVRWHDQREALLLAYGLSDQVAISHQDPAVNFTTTHNSSYITIKKVRPDDEGCYRCVFDVFPVGRQEAVTCVSVTG